MSEPWPYKTFLNTCRISKICTLVNISIKTSPGSGIWNHRLVKLKEFCPIYLRNMVLRIGNYHFSWPQTWAEFKKLTHIIRLIFFARVISIWDSPTQDENSSVLLLFKFNFLEEFFNEFKTFLRLSRVREPSICGLLWFHPRIYFAAILKYLYSWFFDIFIMEKERRLFEIITTLPLSDQFAI